MSFTYSSNEITELEVNYVKKKFITISKTEGDLTLTGKITLGIGQPFFKEAFEEKFNEIFANLKNT